MSNLAFMSDMAIPALGGTVELTDPSVRGRFAVTGLVAIARQLLTTDAIGTHALTLTNVAAGSRVHIESQDGTTQHYDQVAGGTAGTFVTVSPTVSVYSAGNAKNNWRIRVRKGSGTPFYIPYETLMTATVGSSSIYVSQIPDE